MRPSGSAQGSFRAARDQARQVLDDLRAGQVAPVYLCSGDDDHQRQALLHALVDHLVPADQRELNLRVLDGRAVTGRDIARELETTGLSFGDEPRRVVLVRDAPFFKADAKAEDSEALRARLSSGLLDQVTLVIEARSQVDKRLSLSKVVLSLGVHVEFVALKGDAEITEYLEGLLEGTGKRISREAIAELTTRVGPTARGLATEIDKLLCYIGDDRDEIEARHVRSLVAPTAALSVFDLVDAVAERRPREALEHLDGMLGQQAEPFMILAMLIRQFRLLLQARYLFDAGLAEARLLGHKAYDFNTNVVTKQAGRSLLDDWKERAADVLPADGKLSLLGQHYFPLWKTLTVARRLETPAVEAALERLLQADLGLKSTHFTPRVELELLVVDLCTRMAAGATVDLATLLET